MVCAMRVVVGGRSRAWRRSASMASSKTLRLTNSPPPLCRLQSAVGGHASGSGRNFSRLASDGMAGPGLVSVLKPKAPP